jgi:membrane protein
MAGLFQRFKQKIRAWGEHRGEVRSRIRSFYLNINDRLGGALGILRHGLNNFNLMRGTEASASLAYYGLFSIFPLLLAIVSIGSMFLEGELVKVELLEIITEWIPISADAVNTQITTVLNMRGPVTVVAIISLLWSGSNVFEKVIVNVNRAFPKGSRPGFLKSRGMALVIILVMVLLFSASLVVGTIVDIFPAAENVIFGRLITSTKAWTYLLKLIPLVLKFLLFLAVYSWIPQSTNILLSARVIGAVVSAVLWELISRLLGWAISSGFTNYEIIYGSLASIIALMFWLYLSGYILFFGAHLVYAIDTHLRRKRIEAGKEEPQAEGESA